MKHKFAHLEGIDTSGATPEQIEEAKELASHPWGKRLFDGEFTFEYALKYLFYHEKTVIRTNATDTNTTAILGTRYQKKIIHNP